MCIFSQQISHVSKTRIFARLAGDRQFLVYDMRLSSPTDVAMILPLPTAAATDHQAEFIDLSDYEDFFDGIEGCFPVPRSRSIGDLDSMSGGPPLVVHRVGAFDASFVPQLSAFGRLDSRFRLPTDVWKQFPGYANFGFAVFQLRAGDARVHPMAFSFATRNPDVLFFPTTHVHDGAVHPSAEFDHALYAQGVAPPPTWSRGSVLPRHAMGLVIRDRTRGIVEPTVPVIRRVLRGSQPNEDVWLRAG